MVDAPPPTPQRFADRRNRGLAVDFRRRRLIGQPNSIACHTQQLVTASFPSHSAQSEPSNLLADCPYGYTSRRCYCAVGESEPRSFPAAASWLTIPRTYVDQH
jgi:hypothetical protein